MKYRKGAIDELKENFTWSNLIYEDNNQENQKKLKNISTKSSLLAPYNTLIPDTQSITDFDFIDPFEDINNPKIIFENDIIVCNTKVKEYNLNYELNNNGEVDNGMLINSKTASLTSSILNNSNANNSKISSEIKFNFSDRIKRNENNNSEEELSDDEGEKQEEQENDKVEKILQEIEEMGYDRKYVLKCVKSNELCHASAIYYLLYNYGNIKS